MNAWLLGDDDDEYALALGYAPAPAWPVLDVPLSEAGVRALGLEPQGPRQTPRDEFLARAHQRAVAIAAAEHPGDDVESWLRRELFVGLADAVAPVDADMVWGEGRDGTEPSRLRGILNGGGSYQGGLAYTRELFGDTVPMPDFDSTDPVPDGLTRKLQHWVQEALREHHRMMDAAAAQAIVDGIGVLARYDDHGILVSATPDERVPFLEVFEVRGDVDVDELLERERLRREAAEDEAGEDG